MVEHVCATSEPIVRVTSLFALPCVRLLAGRAMAYRRNWIVRA